ncbi:MAG: SDR family oxidoreductase [Chloroflexi bacterium]|nr:SDR family oxidoreductase [Chloroflexota bacterium]
MPHVALITGSSQGLGLAIARVFAERGIGLILTARHAEPLELARRDLAELTRVIAVPGDVVDPAHVERLVAAGLETFGSIDILINNASELGPTPMPELIDLDPDAFVRTLDVNLVAPLRLIQHVLPAMRTRGEGLVINVTSDAGLEAYPTWGGYGASKAGLEHLSRVLAAELEDSSVRVFVVDPGDMNTDMHRAAEPGVDLSHLPTPDLIVPAFVRLLDEPSHFGRFEAQQLLRSPEREIVSL